MFFKVVSVNVLVGKVRCVFVFHWFHSGSSFLHGLYDTVSFEVKKVHDQ